MSVLADLRLSCRALINNPGFTLVAVTMLALGIGVNATVFTVTNAVLFKGFPLVQRNDRLVYIAPRGSNCCVSYPDFLDWRAQAKSFEGMAIVHGVGKILSDPSGFATRLDATEVSANTFRLVGQRPILGRDFAPSDEIPGAPAVTILSYGFWESRYGKDTAVVGRALRMNDVRTTVIGVMPSAFSFPQKQDLWVPLVATATVLKRENRDTWMAIGRLADGVTIKAAQREMEVIGKRLAMAYPVTNQDLVPEVQNFTQFFIGADAATLYGAMWGAVGFVLLIACANLANLLLARAIGRSREISIRIALGAGRWRIIRQLLIESVLLSGIGGFFGWWIAKWGVRTYALAMAQKASWLIVDYTMDHRVLGYLIAISIGTGLVFGMAPALRLSKLDVNVALKDGGRGATAGGRGKHLSAVLVIGEMALAVVLLAGAGVMIRSFLKVHNATLGINTANVLTGSVALPANQYPGADAQISFFGRLTTHLEGIPGVESVAIADATPQWGARRSTYEIEGDAGTASQDARRRPSLHVVVVSPKYFHTLQATMLAGRDFNDHDGATEMPLAIVNQRLADKFWPGEDPLGKRLRLFDGNTQQAWRSVVGVVSNINQSDETRQQFEPLIYLPYRQKPQGVMWIFARTSVPPDHLATAFRREFQTLDRDLPLYGPITLEKRLEVFSDRKFYGALFVIFAAIAVLLASIGLYTVIAHSVSQRTQEIGIRIAIGATAGDIRRLVLLQGMLPLAVGLAIGLAASFAVNRLLKSQLVQVSPADPVTLVVASGVLILAATLGCMLPVRRAMRVDPVIALRHE
jgi:putative ABC transport system permease protein